MLVEECLQQIQKELSELKLEVKKTGEKHVAEPAPPVQGPQLPQVGPLNWRVFFSAEEVQETIVGNLQQAGKGGNVWFGAYTFDRRDIGDALVAAVQRGCRVQLLVDQRQTLKGPREQLSVLQELSARGVPIKLLSGKSLTEEYKRLVAVWVQV